MELIYPSKSARFTLGRSVCDWLRAGYREEEGSIALWGRLGSLSKVEIALKPFRLDFELEDAEASPKASCRELNPAPCKLPSRGVELYDFLLGAALAMEPTSEPPGLVGLLSPDKLVFPFSRIDVGDMEALDEEPAMAPDREANADGVREKEHHESQSLDPSRGWHFPLHHHRR